MQRETLDELAGLELGAEAERHRRSLDGLTLRDTGPIVAEASRHFDRVGEIMRDFARRTGAGTFPRSLRTP
jgi:hypothetical protein